MSAGRFFPNTTPLLEKELGPSFTACGLDLCNPFFTHGPGSWTTLSADDHPMNISEVGSCYRSKQRFERNEAHHGANLAKFIDAIQIVSTFDTGSEPDIFEYWQ